MSVTDQFEVLIELCYISEFYRSIEEFLTLVGFSDKWFQNGRMDQADFCNGV